MKLTNTVAFTSCEGAIDVDSFSQHMTESKHPTSTTTAIDRFLASPVILKKVCNDPLMTNGRQNGLNLSHRSDASNAQRATTGAEQNYRPQTNSLTVAYLAEGSAHGNNICGAVV